MVKINLSDRKFVVLIAALLSSTLAFIILRSLLTNPGIIEAIDIQWNQNFAMFEYFFHTWNFYSNGSNIIFASQFPIYGWVLVLRDVAIAQRFVYFLTVSLISFNMFLVAFYTLKRTAQKTAPVFLGSIVASLFYTLNPLIFSEIFHISFLWAYSLFPLVFYFGWDSFNAFSRRKVLVSALLLSIFFAFMADSWGMLVGLIILVIVAISSAVINGWKNLIHRFIPNFLLTLLIMGIVTVFLAAYWFLPYITQRASEPVWDLFSVANLVRNSQDSSLSNIFGLYSWNAVPFFAPNFWWSALTLLMPIVAVLAVLVRRNKLTLTLSSLLVVGLFLATGVKYAGVSGTGVWPPFGDLYLWLTFYSPRVLSVQSFLLKYPYLFLAMASLAISVLSAVLVTELFGRLAFNGFSLRQFSTESHRASIVLFFSIISLIALVGVPLLTGNLMGALNPVTLPSQYEEVNKFFASQNGTFRVMWVPQAGDFTWSNNAYANKIEYWGSGAPPLLYGWGIVASPNTGFLGNMIYDYLLNNQTQYLGKLLALGNVRFIVFHNDSKNGDLELSSQAFESYFTQYKNYANSFLSSDEYNYYFLSVNKTTGGTDDNGYLNFIIKAEYLKKNYTNSSDYQNLLESPEVDAQYKNSSFYKNLPYARVYLNDSLNSIAYQSYLNNSSKEYQNFIDSSSYNSSHNYLDSSEYLISTGSQYFANSMENENFINSVEYRGFLDYYFTYTSDSHFTYLSKMVSPDYARAVYAKYDGTYKNFQNSEEYTKYHAPLNYVPSNYQEMFNNLQAQKDLKLVTIPNIDDNESLFVYENMEMMNYFQAYSKANLVVGGLDTVGSLSSIRGFYLNDSTYIFVENQGMSESKLASFLNSKDIATNVLFYNNKTMDDLVLDTLDSSALIAPNDVFLNTSQGGWLKDVVTSYSWTPLTLGNYNSVNASGKYDFGLGHNLLYTTNDQPLNFDLNVDKQDEYDFWVRLLFSPAGGNLSFSIDGYDFVVNTNTTKVINSKTTTSSATNTIKMADTNITYLTNSSYPIIDSNPNKIIDNYSSKDTYYYNNSTLYSYLTKTPDFSTDTTIVTNTFTTNNANKTTTNYANGNTTIVTSIVKTILNNTVTTAINDTLNSILSGFKWVRLGNITLDSGTHVVNIENEKGALNAVNLVALPTVSELEKHKQNVLDLLTQSDARIVYLMDKAFLGSLSIGGNLSVPFSAPKQSLYNINLQSNQQLSELNLIVDNIRFKAIKSSTFAEGKNWYSTGQIDLSQGSHNITLSNSSSQDIEKIIIYSSGSTNSSTDSLQKILGGGAEPFVVSYQKTDLVSFSIVVNTSKTFVLSFHEAYDEFWQSNISATRLILNSVDNGFLVNVSSQVSKNELVTINVTYSPESAFQLGIKVTVVSFVFVTTIILLVQVFPKFKKKLAS